MIYTGWTQDGRREFFAKTANLSGCPSNLPSLVPPRNRNKRGKLMNRRLFVPSTLMTAVGLALAMQAPTVRAQGTMDYE